MLVAVVAEPWVTWVLMCSGRYRISVSLLLGCGRYRIPIPLAPMTGPCARVLGSMLLVVWAAIHVTGAW